MCVVRTGGASCVTRRIRRVIQSTVCAFTSQTVEASCTQVDAQIFTTRAQKKTKRNRFLAGARTVTDRMAQIRASED